MSKRKQIRTKGAKSQWSFDNIISDLKDDELIFMSIKYTKELLYFRTHNDMALEINQQKYLEMQQRKKMVDEELRNRKLFRSSNTGEVRFYPDEGTVINEDNDILEIVAYNQDETEIITLPSGNMGESNPEWTPKIEVEEDIVNKEYTMMADVELTWEQWIKKKKLDETNYS